MKSEEIESREDAIEFLKSKRDREWYYSEANDTWITDLNETLTDGDLAESVLRNIDEELILDYYELKRSGISRTEFVSETVRMLEGVWVSTIIDASYAGTEETGLDPGIKNLLPYLYPTKIIMPTGLIIYPVEIFMRDKICPLYYQNVPDQERGGRIAILPTIHMERNGRMTGEVYTVPDNEDRGLFFFIDFFDSIKYKDKVNNLKKLTKYPISGNGLTYKF